MGRLYVYRPMHPRASRNGFVDVDELGFEIKADSHVPVVTDRYMEGTRSPVDSSDIGSRSKRKEHMKLHGLADADDFKGQWAKAEKERENTRLNNKIGDPRERRESIARAMYELRNKPRR